MSTVGEVLQEAWIAAVNFFEFGGFSRGELISIAILLVTGIIGGRIVSELIRRLLKMTFLDDVAVKADVQPILRKFGYSGSLSDLLADLVRYFVYFLVFIGVFNLLGVQPVLSYLQVILSYFPTVILAVFVVVVGFVVSARLEDVIGGLLRSGSMLELIDEMDPSMPAYRMVSRFVRITGSLVAILIALAILGVNEIIIHSLLAIFAVAVAAIIIISLQDVIRNVAVSIHLQLSGSFSSGDRVMVDGKRGKLTHITPLYTKLESGGKSYFIPNTELLKNIVEYEE